MTAQADPDGTADGVRPSQALCEDCEREKTPDITGEYRCKPCDQTMDDIAMWMWEEAVADGKA